MLTRHGHGSCTCCGDLLVQRFDRRHLLRAAGGIGLAAMAAPFMAIAAEGNYEAMVLACIDPRMQQPVADYCASRGLTGRYSQFVIAGAAIGVVAPVFTDWHKAFWDNLETSRQLHHITRVIAIDHRDCGAAKIAYGDAAVATKEAETETHRAALVEFRRQVGDRKMNLAVETCLMSLDGTVETFG
jgi:carbonic anhydrase